MKTSIILKTSGDDYDIGNNYWIDLFMGKKLRIKSINFLKIIRDATNHQNHTSLLQQNWCIPSKIFLLGHKK